MTRKTSRKKPMRIEVTEQDIRDGVGGDCFHCAVAKALHRATGDDHANVYRRDYMLYVEVWSMHVEAPFDVNQFVNDFDDAEEGETPTDWYGKPLEPFTFELPPSDSKEWKERCYGCEELVDRDKVDDDGCCSNCRD